MNHAGALVFLFLQKYSAKKIQMLKLIPFVLAGFQGNKAVLLKGAQYSFFGFGFYSFKALKPKLCSESYLRWRHWHFAILPGKPKKWALEPMYLPVSLPLPEPIPWEMNWMLL